MSKILLHFTIGLAVWLLELSEVKEIFYTAVVVVGIILCVLEMQ